jgi:cellulose synthase/poly-beta-1,6-N-acetylglucosamine synthase-like glycosyltransferase
VKTEAALEWLSYGLAGALSSFGFGGLLLVVVRLLRPPRASSAERVHVWPKVVTQLPIYNEPAVVARVIRSAVAMDYPAGLHEVQVLDDSTDGSERIAAAVVGELQSAGKKVTLLRRDSRDGYKAGALAAGLGQTDAEYVAMFDADFIPPEDFLRRMIPQLVKHPRAGFAQARWGHLNADDGWLTLAQAAQVEAHFCVQQQARAAIDWLMNFNGSAGVWRVAAIQAAGGWQGDTLTEDLDLSHRAALCGWSALYLDDVVVPAELPAQWSAYRQQQHRWAMGSTQALRKLVGPLWCSGLSYGKKLIGTLHLAQYLAQPLLVLHCLLVPWLPQAQLGSGQIIMLAALLTAAMPVMLGRTKLSALFAMMLMGTGMAWTGTCAVWAALTGKKLPFQRTPKGSKSIAPVAWPWVEFLLGAYSVWAVVHFGLELLPVMAMHLVGNTWVCILATLEVRNASRVVD